MENILSLTPMQQLIILAVNAWMFVVFPIVVLRKLKHITDLLEMQIDDEEEEEEEETLDPGE